MHTQSIRNIILKLKIIRRTIEAFFTFCAQRQCIELQIKNHPPGIPTLTQWTQCSLCALAVTVLQTGQTPRQSVQVQRRADEYHRKPKHARHPFLNSTLCLIYLFTRIFLS